MNKTEYMRLLSSIWNAQWGSENRSPIHRAAEILADEYDAEDDISEELAVIASAMKGEDMRVAIHDALYKLGQAKEKPTPTSESVTVDDLFSTESYVEGYGVVSQIETSELTGKNVKWCCETLHISSDSSGRVSVIPEEDGLALLFVAARSSMNPTVVQSDEWELVVEGEKTSSIGFGFDVYKKAATKGTSVYADVTKSGNYNLYCMLCVEYGASDVSVIDDVKWTESSFTPTAKTSNRRIYAAAAPNSSTQYYTPAVIFEESNGLDLKRINAKNQVFLAHDYQNEVNSTPNLEWGQLTGFSSGDVTSLTLDILEG